MSTRRETMRIINKCVLSGIGLLFVLISIISCDSTRFASSKGNEDKATPQKNTGKEAFIRHVYAKGEITRICESTIKNSRELLAQTDLNVYKIETILANL